MVLKVADGTDFGVLADNLRSPATTSPRRTTASGTAVSTWWPQLDPTITPELQYVVLLEDQGLVVTSDNADYAASRPRRWPPVTATRPPPQEGVT